MPRPRGPKQLARRLRAFELHAAGVTRSEIARELGVTRQAITHWGKIDRWDDRMSEMVHRAETALTMHLGDQIAHILKSLRSRMGQRVAELEGLCSSRNEHVRLKAISAWLRLAGVEQAIPNPVSPIETGILSLVEDLEKDTGSPDGLSVARHGADQPAPLDREAGGPVAPEDFDRGEDLGRLHELDGGDDDGAGGSRERVDLD